MPLLALGPVPAQARISSGDPAWTYVQARAAAIGGDPKRSAELLTDLAEREPGQADIAKKAIAAAIGAGQIPLALQLARRVPPAALSTDARLMLAADALRGRRSGQALQWLAVKGDNGDLSFLAPLVVAWDAAERGDLPRALGALNSVPGDNLLGNLRIEERAFILLKFRRTAEADPLARQALANAGAREDRLRLAFADGFVAAGDKARALAIIAGMGGGEIAARQRIAAGAQGGQAIDSGAKAMSEALLAFARELARAQRTSPPLGLVQVARYADPRNSSATGLLAVLLDSQGRDDDALALLRSVPAGDAMISPVRDLQVRFLTQDKRFPEALAIASAAVALPTADVGDYSRLADALEAAKRHNEAADAYARAIASAKAANLKAQLWPLLLLQAGSLQDAGRWPEAKRALEEGLLLEPDQPFLLNFLGYAKLERGEDVDAAEAMIRKASALAPDDASIMDSLGWAQFKRGKFSEAIATLQEAASKDASQAEIQEHLGDALYTAGQKFQARFAWNAALVTAEDDVAARVKAKLAVGLTKANSAP